MALRRSMRFRRAALALRTRSRLRRAFAVALVLALPFAAPAQDVPPPVQGITFDEWTSANARLAAGRPLAEVLSVLRASEGAWNEANAAFGKALASGPGQSLEALGWRGRGVRVVAMCGSRWRLLPGAVPCPPLLALLARR